MRKILQLILCFLLMACNRKEIGLQRVKDTGEGQGRKLFIINEGNFGWGNASLSLYYSDSGLINNDVFYEQNQYNLGDVAQSAVRIEDEIWLVVNNSGKIEVLDTNFRSLETIGGVNSPRFISQINSSQAYITDMYADQISIVDIPSRQIIGSIQIGEWSENILTDNQFAYVGLPESGKLIKLSTSSHNIIDTLILTKGINSVIFDNNNNIWALCNGGSNEYLPVLYQIDPVAFTVLKTLTFSSVNESPHDLCYDTDSQELYYLNNGLCKVSVNASQLNSMTLFSENGRTFYHLFYDWADKHFYISDVKDYIQNSDILILDSSYQQIAGFSAGVISTKIYRLD